MAINDNSLASTDYSGCFTSFCSSLCLENLLWLFSLPSYEPSCDFCCHSDQLLVDGQGAEEEMINQLNKVYAPVHQLFWIISLPTSINLSKAP